MGGKPEVGPTIVVAIEVFMIDLNAPWRHDAGHPHPDNSMQPPYMAVEIYLEVTLAIV
jgi:hypothetical protein